MNTKSLSNHSLLMRAAENFPPISTTVTQLIAAVGNSDSTVLHLAEIAQQDPALSAHILREANSASSVVGREVGELDQAIMRLGMARVLRVAVARDQGGNFTKPLLAYKMSGPDFAKNAFVRSQAAEVCMQMTNEQVGRELVVSALLCDFGKVIMDPFIDDVIAQRFLEIDPLGLLMERQMLDTDHAEVSAYLLTQWQLPEQIVVATRLHEEPADNVGACLVHVCDRVADEIVGDHEVRFDNPQLDQALARLGIAGQFGNLVNSVSSKVMNQTLVTADA